MQRVVVNDPKGTWKCDIRAILADNPLKGDWTRKDVLFNRIVIPKIKGECSVNEQLFRFAVLWQPTEKQREDGAKSRIVVAPSDYRLYKNEKEVVMVATKAIPEEEMANADQLEVLVSPF